MEKELILECVRRRLYEVIHQSSDELKEGKEPLVYLLSNLLKLEKKLKLELEVIESKVPII